MRAAVLTCLSVLVACSSIPDVAFEDPDGGAGDGGAASDAGEGSSGWKCPSNPPPQDKGICCGSRLCLRCSQPNHCERCEREGCSGQSGGSSSASVCCRTGNNSIDCRRQSFCD